MIFPVSHGKLKTGKNAMPSRVEHFPFYIAKNLDLDGTFSFFRVDHVPRWIIFCPSAVGSVGSTFLEFCDDLTKFL